MSALALDRTTAPPAGAVRPFQFPGFLRQRLAAGVEVYAARLPGRPVLSLELLAPAGAQFDPPGQAGLATLTGALLDEGAGGRTAMEIASHIEHLGGQLATGADWDVGYGGLLLLARHAEEGLRLLSDVLAAPSFETAEVERLRRLRQADLLRRRHQPAALAEEQLAAVLYAGTVYANSALGTEATLAALDRDAIVEFYRRRYPLAGSTLIAVGDLEPERLFALAAEALAAAVAAAPLPAWEPPAGGRAAREVPDIRPPALPAVQVRIVDRPGAAQTELRIGHTGVPRVHPDHHAIVFLNTLLGGKFTSRINLNLRERHGYTYSASSRFAARLGPGPFVVSSAVSTEVAGAAAREVLAELRRIQDEPVSDDEMEETRSYIVGVFPYTVQSVADVGRRLADLAVHGLPDTYYDDNLKAIGTLTHEDIQRAAQNHLRPDRLAIVAVGPADVLAPQFEGLGEIVVGGPVANEPSTAAPPTPLPQH